jgi:hypothetical protein
LQREFHGSAELNELLYCGHTKKKFKKLDEVLAIHRNFNLILEWAFKEENCFTYVQVFPPDVYRLSWLLPRLFKKKKHKIQPWPSIEREIHKK